jgi:transposase
LISWVGLCPRLEESAGKRHSTRLRHGAPWLKTTLVQAAWGATRAKGTYLQAQFHRIKGRRGPKKAIIAMAASMLTDAYSMPRDGVEYRDIGGRDFEDRDKQQVTDRLLRRLRDLGVSVEIKAA